MEKKELTLKWKKANEYFEKKIENKKMLATFKGIYEGFCPNNEISKKLIEIIPETTQIEINWDNTADVNQVYYTVDGVIKGIPIIKAHGLVWKVFETYCK